MACHIICFVSFRCVSFRFVSFRFDLFRFVSIRFVSFRFVSFRFDLFRFVSVSFRTLQGPIFWFSPLAIDDQVFGHIMQNYVIISCLLSMDVSSAQLTILGMPDREKRWIERRSYFIREKAILSWMCEVIDYFIVPLDLMNRPQFLYTCGQNIHLSCKKVMSENSEFNMFEF